MTREEAKAIIEHIIWCTPVEVPKCAYKENPYAQEDHDKYLEALHMAAEALKAELCDDAISRQAVLDALRSDRYDYAALDRYVKDMPSVSSHQRTGRWIDDKFGSKCSCCGIYTHLDRFDMPIKSKCCSMCGTKMEVEHGSD